CRRSRCPRTASSWRRARCPATPPGSWSAASWSSCWPNADPDHRQESQLSDAPALDVRSDICWSDATSVTVLGRDLCTDIIGELDFGSFAFLLLTERMPSAAEGTLFNAALVSLVEHGITPNAMAPGSPTSGRRSRCRAPSRPVS